VPDARTLSDDQLEAALRGAAPFVAYPEVPDLSGLVGRRIRETPVVGRRSLAGSRRELRRVLAPRWAIPARAAVSVAVAVAIFAGTMVFSPSARHAVAGWFGLRGVKIVITPSPTTSVPVSPSSEPTSIGRALDLGTPVTLAQIQGLLPFQVGIPSELGAPDEVYLRTGFIEDQVILLYRPRPDLPEAKLTGAGLLLMEFQARIDTEFLEKKIIFAGGTSVDPVMVNGDPGYWIEGSPHEVSYFDRNGNQIPDQTRLAGNVLLWQHGDVTYRIEADISKDQALRIAESLR
jgi:Domain of unknown function (DUF4367)